jgi:TolB-like protein
LIGTAGDVVVDLLKDQILAQRRTRSGPTPLSVERSRIVSFAATLMIALTAGHPSSAQNPAPIQTLCILDFQRLGDDSRADWLEQGLADSMLDTMGSISPYLVIERKHLREILREHALARSGLVDVGAAVRGARLAKAQLLLQGSFVRQGDQLTIQIRLIRVSDQQVLAQTTWSDRYSAVLSAPGALSEKLLRSLASPFDPRKLERIENLIPTTLDEATSYYHGVRAFDVGQYPKALAYYLEAGSHRGGFRKAHTAVLEMYYLLGRSDHAVLFARDLALSYEAKGDVPSALEYYFAAAREFLAVLSTGEPTAELTIRALSARARLDRRKN